MEKNYSKSEILKFLYGELDPQAEKEFIEELYTNEELFQEFEALQEAQASLNLVEIEFQPSSESVDAIMAHVKTAPKTKNHSIKGRVATANIRYHYKFFATAAMLIFAIGTLGFLMVAYQKSNGAAPSDPEKVLSWEAPAIHDRIEQVRTNLGNMSGERQLPIHLNNNTYRIINTAEFDAQPSNVVLVNLNVK